MTSPPVRVRIAPSPTGPLHVGTARTALFNVLFARSHGGSCVLRIEDTDRARSTLAFEQDIIAGLTWLGIFWDEGPGKGGPHAPYRQSEREDHYRQAVRRLIQSRAAYRCFCAKERLDTLRLDAQRRHAAYRYDGACRAIAPAESEERAGKGEPFVVRLRVDLTAPVILQDLIRGEVRFAPETLDDFVVSKGEKEPLYHLAVVVDDAAMAITHVIRGEDHISNTSKHLLLQQVLAVPTPAYAHVPLLLDEKRAKLSKRSGSAENSVAAYRDAGILPQAMVNLLALLGWNPKTAEEVLTLEELVQRFRLEQVQKGGAVFSAQRLDWMNRQYLRRSAAEALFLHVRPFLERAGLEDIPRAQLLKSVEVERTRLTRLTEFPAALAFLREPLEINVRGLPWQDSSPEEARAALSETRAALAALSFGVWDDRAALQRECLRVADASGKSRGAMLWPVRYAFSGKDQSAGPGDLAWVLGRAAALFRLERAEKLLMTTP